MAASMHNSDDDDIERRMRIIGEPNGELDAVEFAGRSLSIGVQETLPLYREGFDWTTIVHDGRAAAFVNKEARGYQSGEVVVQGRVVDVQQLQKRSGLRVDVVADPYVLDAEPQ